MENFAILEPFFEWLAGEPSFEVTLTDRLRISRLLRAEGDWTLDRLEDGLAALLTRDPESSARFRRSFRQFFVTEALAKTRPRPLDREALIGALERLNDNLPTPEAAGTVITLPTLRVTVQVSSLSVTAAHSPQFRLCECPWPEASLQADRTRPLPTGRISVLWAKDDPSKPRQFLLARVGGRPAPLLDDRVLDHLADAMGYFRSQRPSRELDVDRSLCESLQQLFPVLRFLPGREVCHLMVLEDTTSQVRVWNTVPGELAAGLAQRGVPVTHGLFDGSPARFRLDDGLTIGELDDWQERRQGLLLLLFSEGKHLFRRTAARVLDDLANWPRVAWMDFREPQFWDDCTALAADKGLLIFPATQQGLLDMSRAMLTEQGAGKGLRGRDIDRLRLRLAGLPLAQQVEQTLGDALPWLQSCAMLPSVPLGLGDALRRRFHPEVHGNVWGRVDALPGTRRDVEGWHLADNVQDILRQGFFAQRTMAEARQVLGFVCEQIETAGRFVPPDSLARFACEGVLLRLSILAGDAPDAGRVAQLTRSDLPIAEALTVELRDEATQLRQLGRLAPGPSKILEDSQILPSTRLPPPPDMVRIPAGRFWMGDHTEVGWEHERPRHEVEVGEFFIGKHPVTWRLWRGVRDWAVEHGYQFDNLGKGRGDDHPVTNVNWYDAVKWCNARSELEKQRPAYYTDAGRTEIYRRGRLDLPSEAVDWTAEGYRLPTEAEWEKAARGGLEGHYYPWESRGEGYDRFISRERANYEASKKGGTAAVQQYEPNGYGLYDMAGNVCEWTWDQWDEYSQSSTLLVDPHGAGASVDRVDRGGGWRGSAWFLRCAYRDCWHPSIAIGSQGFRLAGGQADAGSAELDEGGERGSRDETPSEPPEESAARASCLIVELLPSGSRAPNGSPDPVGLRPSGTASDSSRISLRVQGASDEVAREVAVGEPVLVQPGVCRVSATRRFCWPVSTSHELEAGKAYRLQILMQRQPPPDMVEIPAGPFLIGDPTEEGYSDERPQHLVHVSAFFIAKYQVTLAQWRDTYDWAIRHGYQFDNQGNGFGDDHPVHSVNWYDVVKWCNALSEREERQPTYFTDRIGGTPYKQGQLDLSVAMVDWQGEGYRLPTEAEWEKAARGGLEGHHYPWESKGTGYEQFISSKNAHYGVSSGTVPVGSFPANGYGLYDMVGNLWEWCWDWFDGNWYMRSEASGRNTRGPESGVDRVYRGGGWEDSAGYLRCAYRFDWRPSDAYGIRGFRPAAGQPEAAVWGGVFGQVWGKVFHGKNESGRAGRT